MKILATIPIVVLSVMLACKTNKDKPPVTVGPEVVAANGYVVPKDSIAEPKVIPVAEPRVVHAGQPKVVLTNSNVHPAGVPRVLIAGVPRVCTPGEDSFLLPKTVAAIDSPFMAGI